MMKPSAEFFAHVFLVMILKGMNYEKKKKNFE